MRDHFERLGDRRIVAARLLQELPLNLLRDEVQHRAELRDRVREPGRPDAQLRTTLENQLAGFLHEIFARSDVIDHAALERGLCGERLAAENDVERLGQANEPGQPGGAAPRWNNSELGFWQANLCHLVRRRDAVVAREANFVAAADTRAMNRGNARNVEQGQPIEDRLTQLNHVAQFIRRLRLGQLREVGARDED